ncbi:hypothetical protein M8J75_004366 [Diaphorina citri]|nr:hypothetical protein M8J75_004366 [Diaphorina citri]
MSNKSSIMTMPGKLGTNDVHYLLQDELDFEIRLRQGNPRDLVSDKRIQLRRLINAERSGTLERSTDPINVSEAEIKRVQDEVEKLQVKVDNFTGSYHSTEYARLDVRLVHYSTRVSLWNSEDPEYVATKENLLQIIYSLLRTLDDRADEVAPEDVALPTNSESLAVNVPSVADNQPPRDNSSPIIPISRQPPDQGNEPLQPRVEYETIPQRRNSWTSEGYTTSRGLEQTRTSVLANPINRSNTATFNPKLYQWRLRFSGEPGTMSVESFLDQLDMKRIARHLSWTDIFPSIGDLFQDTALVWYQANRRDFACFSDLVQSLRASFREPNYDILLWKEIMNRHQGPNESVISYLSKLRMLFERLKDQVTVATQITIIITNALPKYQEMLNFVNCETMRDLETSFRRLEVCHRGESNRNIRPIEPELCYNQHTDRHHKGPHNKGHQQRNSPNQFHNNNRDSYNYQPRSFNNNYPNKNYRSNYNNNVHYSNKNYDNQRSYNGNGTNRYKFDNNNNNRPQNTWNGQHNNNNYGQYYNSNYGRHENRNRDQYTNQQPQGNVNSVTIQRRSRRKKNSQREQKMDNNQQQQERNPTLTENLLAR